VRDAIAASLADAEASRRLEEREAADLAAAIAASLALEAELRELRRLLGLRSTDEEGDGEGEGGGGGASDEPHRAAAAAAAEAAAAPPALCDGGGGGSSCSGGSSRGLVSGASFTTAIFRPQRPRRGSTAPPPARPQHPNPLGGLCDDAHESGAWGPPLGAVERSAHLRHQRDVLLAQLTPEQRAAFDAAMRGRHGEGAGRR
jgi:hypothetical protein